MGVTADSVVVELIARVDKAEADIKRYAGTFDSSTDSMGRSARALEQIVEQLGQRGSGGMKKLGDSTRKAANDIDRGSAQAANATRNLGRQISDIGVGLASGQSPFLILAQQAPQVADALADTGGKAAKLAAFFAGPWGAALLAAGSIAGVLAGKLLDGGEASKTQKDQLQRLTDALSEYQRVNSGVASSEYVKIRLLELTTRALADQEVQTRKNIVAQLDLARADAKSKLSAAQEGHEGGSLSAQTSGAARASAREVIRLDAELASQNKRVAEAERNARVAAGKRATADLAANPAGKDPIAAAAARIKAANDKYDLTIFALDRSLAKNEISVAQHTAATDRATRARDAVVDADQLDRRASAADRRAAAAARRSAAAAKREATKLEDALASGRRAVSDLAKTNRSTSLKDLDLDIAGDFKKVIDEVEGHEKGRQMAADEAYRKREDAPGAKYLRSLAPSADERAQQIDEKAVGYLETFNAELDDSVKKALHLHGVLGDIVGDLIDMAIKQALIKPIANKLFGAEGGTGGLLGSLTSLLSGTKAATPARASGGYVGAGQLYRVNEGASAGRVEGFRPQGSGEIIPLGQMKAAQGGGAPVYQSFRFDLSGAVLTSDLLAQMNAMADDAATRGAVGGSSMAQTSLARRARSRLG